jgi:hypothetical protein
MRMLRWTSLALAGVVAAAVGVPAHAQQVEIKPTVKIKRDKYVITAAEIAQRQDLTNAYDAVKLLRPEYLKTTRARGSLTGSGATEGYRPEVVGRPPREGPTTTTPSSSGEPTTGSARTGDDRGEGGMYGSASGGATATTAVLYIDEVKQQTLEEMKNIRAAEVFEIRYMTGNQAAGRYGSGHEGGAILLKTNRTVKP